MATIAAFTMTQIVKLSRVTARQLVYWEAHDVFTASYVDTISGRAYRRIYSYTDVVSLRTLGILRNERKVTLDQIRKAGKHLSTFSDAPWTQTIWELNGEVFFHDPVDHDTVRNVAGQSAFVIDIERVRKQVEAETSGWNERNPDDYGKIDRHRHVQHNQWVIKGTRIPTATIWAFHQAGYSNSAIRRQFPTLKTDDIAAAISHESELRSIESAA